MRAVALAALVVAAAAAPAPAGADCVHQGHHEHPSKARDATLEAALDEYLHFHRREMANPTAQTRYAVYVENRGGLGNHLLPMVATLMYAMLTRRVYLEHNVVVSDVRVRDMLATPLDVELAPVTQQLGLGDAGRVLANSRLTQSWTLRHTFAERDWGYLYCDNHNTTSGQHQFVKFFSNQYFAPALLHNSHVMELAQRMFGDIYGGGLRSLFGPLSRFLFRPTGELKSMLSEFRSQNQLDAVRGRVLGVQIRKEFVKYDHWEKRWQNCVTFVAERELGIPATEAVIFVASDMNVTTIVQEWRRNGMDGVRLVTVPKILGRSANAQVFAALDILILASTDALIVTEGSTFGSSAAGIASITPHVMTRVGECQRFVNAEPHCHYCPGFVSRLGCFDSARAYS